MSKVNDNGQVKVRGIPIDLVEIDAAEDYHGGFKRARLVDDSEVILIATLDTLLARFWMMGINPPFLQLIDRPFDRYVPVPIRLAGIAVATNPVSKPVGLMGWVRWTRILATR